MGLIIPDLSFLSMHFQLFEARGAPKGSGVLENVQLTNIKRLDVKRYSFNDITVRKMFYLSEVHMENVVSLAFHMDSVGEFSVFASKFERISMFGIKIAKCQQFNVLGMTHFSSVASHGIKLACDKFSLAYNWFGHLHDSSFDVEYGLCDIQGNTFYTLSGKPFLSLKQTSKSEGNVQGMPMTGFVFRENKFVSEPVLPFGSLSMPHYRQQSTSSDYVDVDDNQLTCNCLKIGWLLAFARFGYNSRTLAQAGIHHHHHHHLANNGHSSGTTTFIQEMFANAGPCLECDTMECRDSDLSIVSYADLALDMDKDGGVKCLGSSNVIRNYDDTASYEPAEVVRADKNIHEIKSDVTTDKVEKLTTTIPPIISSKSSDSAKEVERSSTGHLNSEFNERIIIQSDSTKYFTNFYLFTIAFLIVNCC